MLIIATHFASTSVLFWLHWFSPQSRHCSLDEPGIPLPPFPYKSANFRDDWDCDHGVAVNVYEELMMSDAAIELFEPLFVCPTAEQLAHLWPITQAMQIEDGVLV